MPVFIYNSLTRKKEELVPLNPPEIRMYSCGVTVYDQCHIGHGRSLYTFDIFRRFLEYRNFRVKFIRNITDIDDKIINKAKELNMPVEEVTRKYIKSYRDDLSSLGIRNAEREPLATQHIPDMISHIQGLIKKGFAYVVEGDVYFRVKKFKAYGKLSGQSIDSMLKGVRREAERGKEDALDFALWKKSKPGEPEYESPWSKGRPGWHIECSVMSTKYLGQSFDIHAGGRDLIFPHHENEIAQSEALYEKPFAKYWMHHGLLTINGQKMAKSLGNFITVKNALAKYGSDILKLFFLSAHYSQPLDFSEEKMEQYKKQRVKFDVFFDSVHNWGLLGSDKREVIFSESDKAKVDKLCQRLEASMDDDFNTPQCLACLFELVDLGINFVSLDLELAFQYVISKLEIYFDIFGLTVKSKKPLPEGLIRLALKRNEYKQKKDFHSADILREQMKHEFGYCISDTKNNITFTEVY